MIYHAEILATNPMPFFSSYPLAEQMERAATQVDWYPEVYRRKRSERQINANIDCVARAAESRKKRYSLQYKKAFDGQIRSTDYLADKLHISKQGIYKKMNLYLLEGVVKRHPVGNRASNWEWIGE